MLRRTNISWDSEDAVVDEWMRAHAANRSAAIRELIRAAQTARTATPPGGRLSEEERAALIDRVVAEVMARLGSASSASPRISEGGHQPAAGVGETPVASIDPDRQEELRRKAARTAGRFLT